MRRNFISGLAGTTSLLLGVAILALAAAPAGAAQVPSSRTLAQGDGIGAKPDPGVRGLQRILKAQGRSLGPAGVDGRFGPYTSAAVRDLQRSFGLPADGVVGPKTRKLLRVLCRADECGRGDQRVASRSPRSGATRSSGRTVAESDGSGSGAFRDALPTVLVLAGLLAVILGYRRWRTSREARAYAVPARTFPAVEVRAWRTPRRRVIGYLGTPEFALTSPEAEAEEEGMMRMCKRRGWILRDMLREVPGGGREALAYALDSIDAGEATCLMVTSLDSVGGSAASLGRVLERLRRASAGFVALDAEIDTTTREGAMAAALVVAVTRGEREGSTARGTNGRHHVRPHEGAV